MRHIFTILALLLLPTFLGAQFKSDPKVACPALHRSISLAGSYPMRGKTLEDVKELMCKHNFKMKKDSTELRYEERSDSVFLSIRFTFQDNACQNMAISINALKSPKFVVQYTDPILEQMEDEYGPGYYTSYSITANYGAKAINNVPECVIWNDDPKRGFMQMCTAESDELYFITLMFIYGDPQ